MSGKRGSRDAVGDESAVASKRLCHSVGPAENSVEARATAVTLVQSLRRQLREAETALDALIPNALGAVDDGSARDDGNAAHDDGGSADGGDSAARDDDKADDDADGAARGADDDGSQRRLVRQCLSEWALRSSRLRQRRPPT